MNTRFLARQAAVAAIYMVLTIVLSGISYGPLQFRVSEVMTLLPFYNKEYIWGITVGCILANIASPFGIVDIIVGSFASFLAAVIMSRMKNIWLASLMPAITNILVGVQIALMSSEPLNFFVVTGQIMLSQFIIVTIIGVPLFKVLTKNKSFVNMLELNDKKSFRS
ncbi:MAG: QueT transporter family protein [Gallicola sp.]|uniref:QueT transporter family protein n=1 Tax=Gallicola sp. Sow4_E12 TaxID=3438785 RepID=UPI0017C8D368|nr:QueT transporter family protein [Gallicola sp.]